MHKLKPNAIKQNKNLGRIGGICKLFHSMSLCLTQSELTQKVKSASCIIWVGCVLLTDKRKIPLARAQIKAKRNKAKQEFGENWRHLQAVFDDSQYEFASLTLSQRRQKKVKIHFGALGV